MKHYKFFAVLVMIVLLTIAIGCGKKTPTAPENKAPNVPSNPSPSNGVIDQLITVDLSWTGGDPDGDPVTYDVYFGTSSTPPLVSDNQSATTYTLDTLDNGTKYYWKITAEDNHGAKSEGDIWNFTTIDYPPNKPNSVSTAFTWYYPQGYWYNPNDSLFYDDSVYAYVVVPTDPEGEKVAVRVDFGNGYISDWSSFHTSGDTLTYSYVYPNPSDTNGVWYSMRVQAKDEKENLSEWSDAHNIQIGYGKIDARTDISVTPSSPADFYYSMNTHSVFEYVHIWVTSGTSVNTDMYDPNWNSIAAWHFVNVFWVKGWKYWPQANGTYTIEVTKTVGSAVISIYVVTVKWPSSITDKNLKTK